MEVTEIVEEDALVGMKVRHGGDGGCGGGCIGKRDMEVMEVVEEDAVEVTEVVEEDAVDRVRRDMEVTEVVEDTVYRVRR